MRAGLGRFELTPPMGVELAGYGYYLGRCAVSVRDPLYARALYIEDGDERALVISCDLLGLSREVCEGVFAHAEAAGIPRERVLIVSIHTHTGPTIKYHEGCGYVNADYVRTVLARGASMRRAVWCHALRNALVPVATGFGGVLAVFFAGSVIIESVFDIPGMGKLSLEALESRDYPVFLGLLSVTSILGLVGQLLSDLAYVLIDPRVRFSK